MPSIKRSTQGIAPWYSGFFWEHDFGSGKVTEATLNEFPSHQITEKVKEDPYRFLICADKFQTGYDEPLLHTMYVDKTLSGIKAVQTLSRLNRAHPKKYDTFVLDFHHNADVIKGSFEPFYRSTILSDETDANRLHDLQTILDDHQIYTPEELDHFVSRYLGGADRDTLDPILDRCVEIYKNALDEDEQVEFKGNCKAFLRTYGFIAAILSYTNADWEKRSIFLNFLVSKLPAPEEQDLSKGILDAIDMDSYGRKRLEQAISLLTKMLKLTPCNRYWVPRPEPEMETLSQILKEFNELFGDIEWADEDRIRQLITETIPDKVARDPAYMNALAQADPDNARIEHDKALSRVMAEVMSDDTELFKQFMDNEGFRRWMQDRVFGQTSERVGG